MYFNSKPNHHFVGRKAIRCLTADKKNAFFNVDFGTAVIRPTHYTLRNWNGGSYYLRDWEFQGSNNGQDWTTIKKHTNDKSLSGKGSSHTWKIEECNDFYSQFKIAMTGTNSYGSWCLCCSGFEIYGVMRI
eukprot:857061_1